MESFTIESVVVTGSDKGIGLGLVQRFLELQNPPKFIFATCRHPDGPEGQELRDLAKQHSNGSKLIILRLDVTDLQTILDAVKKVMETVGESGLTLLINNAGIAQETTLDTENAQSMAATYATNTIGPLQVGQEFLLLLQIAAKKNCVPGMSCSKAAIINISSNYGSISHIEGWKWREDVSYRCSKAALNMLTRCQALGYGAYGILCVAINPGGAETHFGAEKETLTVEASTKGIIKVISSLSAEDNGTFMDWLGKKIPW